MKVKVPGWKSFMYRELWVVVERRGGQVFKTKFVGFVSADRAKRSEDELYVSLSTKLSSQKEIELDLLEEKEE